MALVWLQAFEQLPQLVVVVMSVSQPSAWLPLQLAKPWSQAWIVHVPATQVPVACAGLQGCPHPPQWFTSLFMSTQLPLQSVWPLGQLETHAPWEQTSTASHTVPQAPQL